MIDIIGYDIEAAKKILEKNNVQYNIIFTKPTKKYRGYQRRVLKTMFEDGILSVIVAEF
ncbi:MULTISPECIES: hypothetical protein [Thermoanaerobacterium]|uniref:Uncharacterized protein n=1 Tax=Thermoanaerobacterium xylanolyticum (strain ATCC 49914 / DSM 7097 / LX-11) TaxID=858215 RepID=F6BFJ2_THEXL|nr:MULTISPECIES: hypothetical protein [Thermoanaerobacterium]AEF17331.1 hypothetical protein Thexy_1298 [Thermoanaerobacterium xylanolyticum LX-11]MDE4541809.1 hypothetical protein [Thermoanaerobacterium sp. R66]HHV73622.1 hypothetical protein [Thermoanaerobacterium sp.]